MSLRLQLVSVRAWLQTQDHLPVSRVHSQIHAVFSLPLSCPLRELLNSSQESENPECISPTFLTLRAVVLERLMSSLILIPSYALITMLFASCLSESEI